MRRRAYRKRKGEGGDTLLRYALYTTRATQYVFVVYNWNWYRTGAIGQLLVNDTVRAWHRHTHRSRMDGQQQMGGMSEEKDGRSCRVGCMVWLAYGVADSLCVAAAAAAAVMDLAHYLSEVHTHWSPVRPYRVMFKVALVQHGPSRTISSPSCYHAFRLPLTFSEPFLTCKRKIWTCCKVLLLD